MGTQLTADHLSTDLRPASHRRDETSPPTGPLDRFAGAVATGIGAGLVMYTALAAVAVSQGRGLSYPAYAVQAMLSGRRVLPDHPVATLAGRRAGDLVAAPVMFFLPAMLTALLVTWWVGRRLGPERPAPRAVDVALPAVVLTAVLLVVLVLLLGFRTAEPAVQRVSSGYGVRQLGLAAWLVGHALYAAVLTLALGPTVRSVAALRRSRRAHVRLRGESSRAA